MEEWRMSLSTRALSPGGGNCPREFEDKHKLGQFTSSQSNLNSGDFDAPSWEKRAAAASAASPPSARVKLPLRIWMLLCLSSHVGWQRSDCRSFIWDVRVGELARCTHKGSSHSFLIADASWSPDHVFFFFLSQSDSSFSWFFFPDPVLFLTLKKLNPLQLIQVQETTTTTSTINANLCSS